MNARALLFIIVCNLLLIGLIQAEDYWLAEFPQSINAAQFFQLIAGDLFAALLLSSFATILMVRRSYAFFGVLLLFLTNIYLVLDFAHYRVFFQHLNFSSLEGSANIFALTSSVLYELDKVFYFNIVVVLISSLSIAYFFQHSPLTTKQHKLHLIVISTISLTAVGIFFLPSAENNYHHPFSHALGLLSNKMPIDVNNKYQGDKHEGAATATQRDEALATRQPANTKPLSRPNIVLIAMESVGSEQFLDKNGMPSAIHTPNLHELAKNAVIFNSIYSIFPGTTRSHVALNTGGHAITLSGVFKELSHPYKGPTLARAFKQQGYRTALFASVTLGFENLDNFYRNMGFDTVYDFGAAKERFEPNNWLHSWGAKEEKIVPLAIDWLKKENLQQPFLLVYLNNATHHPYSVPQGYKAPLKKDDRRSRYTNALHYTDHSLKPLLTFLKNNDLIDNTIIAVVGDHGEAFGERHAKNVLHANYLYEENIKNFFMLANPQLASTPVLSQRLGSLGDILPTLLAAANLPSVNVPGNNILQTDLPQRIQYFYKISQPPQWGLREGKWKFINEQTGRTVELYDLERDPKEQRNLAIHYPEKVIRYRRLAATWYAQTNAAYLAQLANYKVIGNRHLSGEELLSAGPKALEFGYHYLKKNELIFNESSIFHPNENVALWTKWVVYPENKNVQVRWTSPNQQIYSSELVVQAGTMETTVTDALPPPMAQGKWRVEMIDQGRVLIAGQFQVDARQPLRQPVPTHSIAREVTVGRFVAADKKEQFESSPVLHHRDQAVVFAKWWPPLDAQELTYIWHPPTGKEQLFNYQATKGWRETWVTYDGTLPMQAGDWSVAIRLDNKPVVSVTFTVLERGTPSQN